MMTDVRTGNLKLTVFEQFPFAELDKVVNAITALGYTATFTDNGNIVFQKVTP